MLVAAWPKAMTWVASLVLNRQSSPNATNHWNQLSRRGFLGKPHRKPALAEGTQAANSRCSLMIMHRGYQITIRPQSSGLTAFIGLLYPWPPTFSIPEFCWSGAEEDALIEASIAWTSC
jgi:hypothetical protein